MNKKTEIWNYKPCKIKLILFIKIKGYKANNLLYILFLRTAFYKIFIFFRVFILRFGLWDLMENERAICYNKSVLDKT